MTVPDHEEKKSPFPYHVMFLSMAFSLIAIIVSCYLIESAWKVSAFG